MLLQKNDYLYSVFQPFHSATSSSKWLCDRLILRACFLESWWSSLVRWTFFEIERGVHVAKGGVHVAKGGVHVAIPLLSYRLTYCHNFRPALLAQPYPASDLGAPWYLQHFTVYRHLYTWYSIHFITYLILVRYHV